MRDDDATAIPPATNEATTELTAPKSFRRLPAPGRASVSPPGTASVTPVPWPRPPWSIDREGAWNATVKSAPSGTPGSHTRSVAALAASRRALAPRTEPPKMPLKGTSAPRHEAGGADRKPCGAAGRPVRCDDTEPDTRHDRHPPEGRQRRTRTHDPLGVAPHPCRCGRTGECPPLASIGPGHRAGTSIGPGAPSSRHGMRPLGQDPFHRVGCRDPSRTAPGTRPTVTCGPHHAFCPDDWWPHLGDSPRRVPAHTPRDPGLA